MYNTREKTNRHINHALIYFFCLHFAATCPAQIFWAQTIGDRIKQSDFNGANVQTLMAWPLLDDPVSIAMDRVNGKIYWAQTIGDRIKRANVDGTNVETLLEWPVLDDPVAIALDIAAGKIYWAQLIGDRIKRANLDGTNVETLLAWPLLDHPVSVALDTTGGKIYWAQLIGDRIKRANLDGTNVETLMEWPLLDNPVSIALDIAGGKIYWAQLIGDRIKRANLDGTNVETIMEWPLLDNPVSIALDTQSEKIYWAQQIGDRIKRADFTGANAETVSEWPVLDDPVALAVMLKVECTIDSDCDDGLFCNGREICNALNVCVTGSNPCQQMTCDEVGQSCFLPCDSPTVLAGGSRYLIITPAPSVSPVALRIQGDANNLDIACVSLYVQSDGFLGPTPIYQLPESWSEVHAKGNAIHPSTLYQVQADCDPVTGNRFSQPVSATTWRWGDVNNDTRVDIADILRIVDGFLGLFVRRSSPCTQDQDCLEELHSPFFECDRTAGFCVSGRIETLDLSNSDINKMGCRADGRVDIADVLAGVNAWLGNFIPCNPICP